MPDAFYEFSFYADNAVRNLLLHTQGRLPLQLFCLIFFFQFTCMRVCNDVDFTNYYRIKRECNLKKLRLLYLIL